MANLTAPQEIAATAVDNIEQLLIDMFAGDYADNEVALGVLLNGKEEIQVQLKITRTTSEFIDTDYDDWDEATKTINEENYD